MPNLLMGCNENSHCYRSAPLTSFDGVCSAVHDLTELTRKRKKILGNIVPLFTVA